MNCAASSPWRDLPDVFGPWNRAFRRGSRWSTKGIWLAQLVKTCHTQPAGKHLFVAHRHCKVIEHRDVLLMGWVRRKLRSSLNQRTGQKAGLFYIRNAQIAGHSNLAGVPWPAPSNASNDGITVPVEEPNLKALRSITLHSKLSACRATYAKRTHSAAKCDAFSGSQSTDKERIATNSLYININAGAILTPSAVRTSTKNAGIPGRQLWVAA